MSEEVERALGEEDTETLTILFHSLKSSARTVGAAALSKFASDLESAGKHGDLAEIKKNAPKLLDEYRKLGALLNEIPL